MVKADDDTFYNLELFSSKNADDRMSAIMTLGDSGTAKAFEILEYAILNDTDKGVVMAGLKRLPNFKTDERLMPLLKALNSKQNLKEFEPYYSMALLNLGLINEEAFNKVFEQ